jgi:hypothetical protein
MGNRNSAEYVAQKLDNHAEGTIPVICHHLKRHINCQLNGAILLCDVISDRKTE